MANETKRSGGATKWLLIGGVLVGGACCLPVSCLVVVGAIGSDAEARERGRGGDSVAVASAPETASSNESTPADLMTRPEAQPRQEVESAPAPGTKPVAAPNPKPVAAAKADGEVRRVGEEFVLGNYAYKVTRWRAVDQIGNAFTSTKATPGGTFVIVECVMTNATNESQVILSSDFKLRDARGREFSTASKVEMALAMADPDNADMILTELQPGLSRTLRQGFEVPKDAVTGGGLVLVIPEKGLFGTKKALVRLE